MDQDLRNIKLKVPSLPRWNDSNAYLEQEKKMELVFYCHNYSEEKRVKLSIVEFTDYAIIWQGRVVTSRKRNYKQPISTQDELKAMIRKRFVPSHYYRGLYKKLQSFTQVSKSVEEYRKEIEMLMIPANIDEDKEATMVRFLNRLNQDIANVTKL